MHGWTTARVVAFTLILPLLLGGSCDEPAAEPRELVALLRCGATANDAVTTLPATASLSAFTGQVRPPEAVSCLHTVFDCGHVYFLSRSDFNDECMGGDGCTALDWDGCEDDEVYFPQDQVPATLSEPQAATFASYMYHESIHTAQRTNRNCSELREVEAYDQQATFSRWLQLQLIRVTGLTRPDPCVALNDAVDLDPCVRQFILDAVPDLDPASAPTAETCAALKDLAVRSSSAANDAGFQIPDIRTRAEDCFATGRAVGALRVSREDYPYFVAVDPGGSVIDQVEILPAGTYHVLGTIPTGLDEVRDLRMLRDAHGAEYLLVAGALGGAGHVQAYIDTDEPEFPADGLFDVRAADLTTAGFREGSELVRGTRDPLLVFDALAQAVFRVVPAGGGLPGHLDPTPAFRVPVGREAVGVSHDPIDPVAYARLEHAPSASSTRALEFEDPDGDVRYEYVAMGTLRELGVIPPEFFGVPVADEEGAWASAGIGHGLDLLPTDSVGAITGPPIGSAVVPAAGQVWLATSRPLAAAEYLRLKDLDTGELGAWVRTAAAGTVQAHWYRPSWGPLGGGTLIRFRGTGLSRIDAISFDSVAASFAVLDDRTLQVYSPPSVTGGTALVTAHAGSVSLPIASFTYDASNPPSGARWETAADFASWNPDGSAGWACGQSMFQIPPSGGEGGGCVFAGAPYAWGYLESPPISLPSSGRLALRLEHRADFGSDGDGLVVQVTDGRWEPPAAPPRGGARGRCRAGQPGTAQDQRARARALSWHTLEPLGNVVRRIDASHCYLDQGGQRACLEDPPAAGLRGFASEQADPSWRVDEYELPDVFDHSAWLRIRLVATNIDPSGPAVYELASAELVPREPRHDLHPSGWTPVASFGPRCDGATTEGPFACTMTSPVPGASGAVLRYSGSSGQGAGAASLPVPLEPLSGRQVSALVRHLVDFAAARAVGDGAGRIEVCCAGLCQLASPVDGYPHGPPNQPPAYTDEGPENVWITDELDLSGWAGAASCSLRFVASGAVSCGQPGWVIDEVTVRWR